MKFKNGIRERNVIVECGAGMFLPFSIVFGMFVILMGTASSGGGFQGGVITASGVILLYLAKATDHINTEILRVNEPIGATAYIVLGFLGLFFGCNFARNVFWNIGEIGELISAGTITFMGYAVGYKVLTGVGFLVLLMLSVLAPGSDEGYDFEEEEEE